jgi:hypothetical protein
VELRPCKAYNDPTANGRPNVHAWVYSNMSGIVPADFEGEVGDIFMYQMIDSTIDPPRALLISPPIEAAGAEDYMVRRMLGGRAAYDYVQDAP